MPQLYLRWQRQVNGESDEIVVTFQVTLHPAYAQYKLWNFCSVTSSTMTVKKSVLQISAAISHKTCSAITFIISFWMSLDVYLSPFCLTQ